MAAASKAEERNAAATASPESDYSGTGKKKSTTYLVSTPDLKFVCCILEVTGEVGVVEGDEVPLVEAVVDV